MARVRIDEQSNFDQKLKEFVQQLKKIDEEVKVRRYHVKKKEERRERKKKRNLTIKIANRNQSM